MRILLLSFLVILSASAASQHFEWASTSSNLYSGFQGGVIDPEGNFVIAGEMPLLNHRTGGASLLYDSNGKEHEVTEYQSAIMIVSYSPEGKINWIKKVYYYGRRQCEVAGLSADDKGNIYLLGIANDWVYTEDMNENHTVDENGIEYEQRYLDDNAGDHFILCMDLKGKSNWIRRDPHSNIESVESFEVSPLGGFVIAGTTSDDITTKAGVAKAGESGNNYVMKLDERLEVEWVNLVQYTRGSCCTYSVPATKAKVGPDGSVYVTGTYRTGAIFSNGKKFDAPILDSVTRYNEPFEGYLASISRDGKLKWVQRSGAKANFTAITATKERVYISGHITKAKKLFDQQVDTTEAKRTVVVGFNHDGKVKWLTTNNGNGSTAIVADREDNVYVVIQSKRSGPENPLILGNDTLTRSYSDLIVASYDRKGKYRWYKKSNVSMSSNEFPTMRIDNCGDIFIAAEMWYTLKVQTSWFDAAIAKGDGYGAAPLVAKLKNSIEKDAIAESGKEKNDNPNENEQFCELSPGPWQLMNYPNPFSTNTTLRLTTTYPDESVQMEVFSLNGQLVATIFHDKSLEMGQHEFPFDAVVLHLPSGIYVVVVKGSFTAVSGEIMVQQ